MKNIYLSILTILLLLTLSCTKDNDILTPYSNTPVVAYTQNAFAYTLVAHNYTSTAEYNISFDSDSLAYSLVVSGYSGGEGLLEVRMEAISSFAYTQQLNSNKVISFTDANHGVPEKIRLVFNNFSGTVNFSLAKSSHTSIDDSFVDFNVGQEWKYLKWEKYYHSSPLYTGDTVRVKVIAKHNDIITFFEKIYGTNSLINNDTTSFSFHIGDSLLYQTQNNNSTIFRFLNQHSGSLLLNKIDSNFVTIKMDSSLFNVQTQTHKNKFIGYSDYIMIHPNSFNDFNVYYDAQPTTYDDWGNVAMISAKEGIISSIYFGAFNTIESIGYNLIK